MTSFIPYIVIGFIVASFSAYIIDFGESSDPAVPPIRFICLLVAWPAVVLFGVFTLICYSVYSYSIWLQNPKKMTETFKFYKEVYILYGEQGANKSLWDIEIKGKYANLVNNKKNMT